MLNKVPEIPNLLLFEQVEFPGLLFGHLIVNFFNYALMLLTLFIVIDTN